jgi:hypothetical protein
MESACRICGNVNYNRTFAAREMMFGTREVFPYMECGGCGTLQLTEVPDLRPHYPKDYLSLGIVDDIDTSQKLKRRVSARAATRFLVNRRGLAGRVVLGLRPWFVENFPPSLRDFPNREYWILAAAPGDCLKPCIIILDFGTSSELTRLSIRISVTRPEFG